MQPMRIISSSPEATLTAVRHLSENAINNPPRKNHFINLIPLKLARAGEDFSLPPLPVAIPERATTTARLAMLFT